MQIKAFKEHKAYSNNSRNNIYSYFSDNLMWFVGTVL